MPRRARIAVMSALAGALILSGVLPISPNAQASAYRYWSYWLGGDSGWTYSSWGPASLRPADGSVEGWRFGVGEGTGGAGLVPRSAADFDRICAGTPPAPDTKRVAIIIDPGLAEHAPPGESPRGAWAMCVTAAPSATGFDILQAATSVRTRSGMVCGLAGYPANECAVVVSTPRPPKDSDPTPSSPPESTPSPQQTTRPGTPTQPDQPTPTPDTVTGAEPGAEPDPLSGSGSSPTSAVARAPGNDGEQVAPSESRTTTGDARDRDRASIDATMAPWPPASAVSPGTPPAGSDGGVSDPDPELTIVSAAVTDTVDGPGPTAAIVGTFAIALLAAAAYLRRRSTRFGSPPDA